MVKKVYVEKSIEEIKPYENNPRIITDEAISAVVESIRANGERDPIEIDEDNVVLSGHTRLEALKRLGIKKTKVIQYTDMDEAQKRAYRIAANKTAEKSLWDEEKLAIELEALKKDFTGLGIPVENIGKFTSFDDYDFEEIGKALEPFNVSKDESGERGSIDKCPKCGYEEKHE